MRVNMMHVAICLAAAVGVCGVQVPLMLNQPKTATPTKRIAVVGTGAGGLAMLKALVQLPEHMRAGWDIVAFERREGIGGVWLPDFNPPPPPALPQSPLYPGLRTNGPHPQITIPHFPFPPETPLVAPHQTVLRYYQSMVDSFGLAPYIKLQHLVTSASWTGSEWNITVVDLAANVTKYAAFDHLIPAPGYNAFPTVQDLPGQKEWLAGDASRSILHCMWYRDPTIWTGKTVVVLGSGPSGWDMIRKISPYAGKIYWSRQTKEDTPDAPSIPAFPDIPDVRPIAQLNANGSALLVDGKMLPKVDAIVLATGYQTRIPFLTAGGHLAEQRTQTEHLTTNGRYMHPLFEHTLSLDPAYPLGALYLGGVLVWNPTGMTSYAQGLFAAYTIARPELLQSRKELMALLKMRESRVRAEGFDPARVGHRWGRGYGPFAGFSADGPFEDQLVDYLRVRSGGELAGLPGIPPMGQNYTDRWRLWSSKHGTELVFAWYTGVGLEDEEAWDRRWSEGRVSEADYFDAMRDVIDWSKEHKKHTEASFWF